MHRVYLSIIAFLLVTVTYLTLKDSSRPNVTAGGEPPSIAVLQFEAIGQEPDSTELAAALTDNLIDTFVAAGGTRVAARSDVEGVGANAARTLGVGFLVSGTVSHEAGMVRVAARLVDGESEEHLWSQTYERSGADIDEFSGEISRSVLTRIGAEAQ